MSDKLYVWEDATSYSRGQRGVKEPTSFRIHGKGRFGIFISCGHVYNPGKWIMTCHPWFDVRELGVETKEEAQKKAIE